MRGATIKRELIKGRGEIISIHAPRERSDESIIDNIMQLKISIHAPRERSDPIQYLLYRYSSISIHAPRERSDVLGAR